MNENIAHLKIIAVPEQEYWVDEEILNSVELGSLKGVYLVDTNVVHRACSVMPLHWCIFLYTTCVTIEGLPQRNRERVYDLIIEGDAYSEDQYLRSDFVYDCVVHDVGEVNFIEKGYETYQEYIDDMVEYFNCNHVI